MKLMGTFLSNFTELLIFDLDAAAFLKSDEIIHFGVGHNYINNYKSRIADCKVKNCPHGSYTIDAKHVTETVKKYFGADFKDHRSVKPEYASYREYEFYFDGKLYHFDRGAGEAVYYARVDNAAKNPSGNVVMTGELYNAEDAKDILGTFEAVAKPHKYGGKDTWSIVSLALTKPAGKLDENTRAMFGVIVSSVYESKIKDLQVSGYKYNLLGEDVDIYMVVCENGRKCDLAVMSDGTVYINENEDTPSFKRVRVANLTYIDEPVVLDYSDISYDDFAWKVARGLKLNPVTVAPLNPRNPFAGLIVDHRKVRIYGVAYEFDIGELIAVDDTTEYVYCAPKGNPEEFFRVFYREDAYVIDYDKQVTVQDPGM